MHDRRRYVTVIILGTAALAAMAVGVVLVGCGGEIGAPAQGGQTPAATARTTGGAAAPAAAYDPGDMDGDNLPTQNDAQMIMNIVVDPDSYDLGQKYIADCNFNGDADAGDALKVLRAAAGEISWPFGGGPPPPPPI